MDLMLSVSIQFCILLFAYSLVGFFCFLAWFSFVFLVCGILNGIGGFFIFLENNLIWVHGEEEKIWKDLGNGKNMMKVYLNLRTVLNNETIKKF